MQLACPEGYAVMGMVRASNPGYGGIAVLHRRGIKMKKHALPEMKTFEGLCLKVRSGSHDFILLSVYRPGSMRVTPQFFEEFSTVVESLITQSCPIITCGDFNIHVEDSADHNSTRFVELVNSFDLTQHVKQPTHQHGGTLDLILSSSNYPVKDVNVDPAGIVSDHSLVSCRLPFTVQHPQYTVRSVRSWRRVDRQTFSDAIRNSALMNPEPDCGSDRLFELYNTTLKAIADKLAPERSVRCRLGLTAPWFDAECRSIRRHCRRLEKSYRSSRSNDDRLAWVQAVREKNDRFKEIKDGYWAQRLTDERQSPKRLWRSLNRIMKKEADPVSDGSSQITADGLLQFFADKVKSVRADVDGYPTPVELSSIASGLAEFRECSQQDVRKIIMESPTKSCALDPVPTFLLKELIDVLLPFITAMVNASLREGRLPVSQKHAIISPLVKKPGLDCDEMRNYRPVSNLTFMSKVIERVVCRQMTSYLTSSGLMPLLQSAYRQYHSTETALVRVISDILGAMDNKKVTILGLLDLSAAFDCVDHDILLERLRCRFGVTGVVLAWVESFLRDRTQQVFYQKNLSSVGRLLYGVPQGSVLGPLLYLLYTAELFDVIAECGLTAHSYADDTQVYLSGAAADASDLVNGFSKCVDRINHWMKSNRLRLNADKTQIIWIGTRQQLAKMNITAISVLSEDVKTASTVNNLGVTVDCNLTMAEHVQSLCRSGWFHLRQLRVIRASLTRESAESLVHAFISSRLDYGNAVLSGIGSSLMERLQLVQNAAARLVSGTRKFDHITPVLKEMHWLPVRQRITYKVAMLVFKCLTSRAPGYLTTDCVPVASTTGRKHLRSAKSLTLVVPRSRTEIGSRRFAVAGPTVWNSLPQQLRVTDCSLATFRRSLKTHLFIKSFVH